MNTEESQMANGNGGDLKYGRLFTEKDVLAIAKRINPDMEPEKVREMIDTYQSHFPKSEPLFVIRGKDELGLGAVRNYRTLATGTLKDADAFIAKVDDVVRRFQEFRNNHPTRLKQPD